MGKTITEKILAKAGEKKEVSPGEYVFLTSPCPVPGIGRGGPPIESLGAKFFDPNMAIVMDDHAGDGGFKDMMDTEVERARMAKRAKALGIPQSNIFVNKGIGHLLAAENCWALPGTVYLSITNGHSTIMGGIRRFIADSILRVHRLHDPRPDLAAGSRKYQDGFKG